MVSIAFEGKLCIHPLIKNYFDVIEHEFSYGPLTSLCFGINFDISKFSLYIGTANGQLVLLEQGWFSLKQKVISEQLNAITSITLYRSFVTYSDKVTIYVLNTVDYEVISAFSRPKVAEEFYDKLILPSVVWKEDKLPHCYTLCISWYNVVKVFLVEENPKKKIYAAQAKYYIESNLYLCGISLFANHLLLYTIEPKTKQHIVKILDKNYRNMYEQILGEGRSEPWEYKCAFSDNNNFIVYSSEEISIAKPITIEQKLIELANKEKYEECKKVITEFLDELPKELVNKVENGLIEYLLNKEKYMEAIEMIKTAHMASERKWMYWISRFKDLKQLDLIMQALLYTEERLSKKVYGLFPQYYLEENQFDKLEESLILLSGKLNLNHVLELINWRLSRQTELFTLPELKRSRLTIAKAIDNIQLAIPLCIELRDMELFELLKKHNEVSLPPLVVDLTEMNPEETVKLVKGRLSMQQLVPYLKMEEKMFFVFLDTAFTIDPEYILDSQYLLPQFYIKYNYEKLMRFLKRSNCYNIVDVLKLCEVKGLYPEQIFLYDKLGDKKTALNLILSQSNIKQACKYIMDEDITNQELWNTILTHCKNTKEIFEYLEYFTKPEDIIKNNKHDIELEEIREELASSLFNIEVKIKLYKTGCKIAIGEIINGIKKYIDIKSRGYQVKMKCDYCLKRLDKKNTGIIIFYCGHHTHSTCYKVKSLYAENEKLKCPVCAGAHIIKGS